MRSVPLPPSLRSRALPHALPQACLLLTLLLWGASEAFATLPEVSNVSFGAPQTLGWDSLAGSTAYHVYRGSVSGLAAGNFGACLIGSVPGTSAITADVPPVGSAYFYLLSGYDPTGEGSIGTTSLGGARNPLPRCIPVRRFFDLVRNGNPGDGVPDGNDPLRNPSELLRTSHQEVSGVYLHTGDFFVTAVDLEIRGKDLSDTGTWSRASSWEPSFDDASCQPSGRRAIFTAFSGNDSPAGRLRARQDQFLAAFYPSHLVARSYRSQIQYDGPLGQGWDSPANARLAPSGNNAIWFSGTGRRSVQTRGDATHFFVVAGNYTYLRQELDGSFFFRDRDGTVQRFHAFDGTNRQGTLESVEDGTGNKTSFLYDSQGLLTTVVDTLGRSLTYAYNPQGRIASITDFSGRSVVYSYDVNGNLTSVRSPIVTGTPNGNDFPSGKTTTYTYSSGFADERLNHNLLSIIPPEEEGSGLPAVQNGYGTDPLTPEAFDRVGTQTIGGTNSSGVAAGGSLTYAYQFLNPGAATNDPTISRRKATVIDRNGNQREYLHNFMGNLLSLTHFTNRNLRPAEPDYTTQLSYNVDGEILQILYPAGNKALFTYQPPGVDRFQDGNLLEMRLQADTIASGGRGNGHGAEANDRVWTFTYEPLFQSLVSATDPRGNDSSYLPPNGGTWSAARYTRTCSYDFQEGDPATNGVDAYATQYEVALGTFPLNLGDLNGDGSTAQIFGNPVRIQDPSVLLAPGSNQALIEGDTSQDIISLLRYNSRGQLTGIVDPEANRHDFEYYPETDPDGDGSPTPTPADGRILDATAGGYLKARTRDTVAAAIRNNGTNPPPALVREDFSYDPVGNLTNHIDGRGVRTRRVVNALNQVVELRRAAATADSSGPSGDPSTGRGETGLTAFAFLTRYAYDANDNLQSLQVEDRGSTRGIGPFITTTWTFDLLDRPVQVDRQATGITTLTTQMRYDANENLIRITEPAGNAHEWAYDERDLLLTQTRGALGPRGGTPSTRSFSFDANGSLAQLVDGRGGLFDTLYDGFDRVARTVDQVGNTDDFEFDPGDDEQPVHLVSRGPVGGPTPANRSGATNVDLAQVRIYLDEMLRPFRVDRQLFVPSGAAPVRPPVLTEGPLVPSDGNINALLEYDRLSRRTFALQDSGTTRRWDYDGAGRTLKRTDPGSNLVEYTFDAGSNLIELAETETPSSSGPPAELFLTTSFYDALGRKTSTVNPIGGTWRRVYDSLDAITSRTDGNGPAGGTINRRSPGHTGIAVAINGHGNVTRTTYDGLDRMLARVRVLTATGLGNGTLTPPPDTTNPNNPDGLITLVTAWDPDSLVAQDVDDKGNTTDYLNDNLDRLVLVKADDATQATYAYDAEDNRTSAIDPNGTSVTRVYDLAQRLTSTSAVPASGVEGTTQQAFQYDGLSRPTSATDNNGPADSTDDTTVTLFYDSLGRLIEEGQLLSNGTLLRTSDLRWLAADRVSDVIYPAGRQIHYAYDTADRLVSVTDPSRPESAAYLYFGLDRVHTRTFANGLRSTRMNNSGSADIGFDGERRTILLRHLDASNNVLAGFDSRYDGAHNRTSVRRLHHPLPGGVRGERYTYDSGNRLVNFTEGTLDLNHLLVPPAADTQGWTLDGVGGWAAFTRNGVAYTDTPNNNNEYDESQSGGTRVDDGIPDDFGNNASTPMADGLNLGHDKSGNQVQIGTAQVKYDFLNRPVRAIRNSDSMTVALFTYDALGRRIRRQVVNSGASNVTRRAHFIGHRILEDRDAVDALVRDLIYGRGSQEILWQVRSDMTAQYFLEDAAQSTVALASSTTPLTILERVTYDAYGKPTFEDAANVPLLEGSNFRRFSQFANTELFHGMHYDFELGIRTSNVNTDLGGLYLQGDPEAGRVEFGDGVRGIRPTRGGFNLVGTMRPFRSPDGPAASVMNPVQPPEIQAVMNPVQPPDIPEVMIPVAPAELQAVMNPVQPPEIAAAMIPVTPPEIIGVALAGGDIRGGGGGLVGSDWFVACLGRRGVIASEYASARDPDGHGTHSDSDASSAGSVEAVRLPVQPPDVLGSFSFRFYNPNQGRFLTRNPDNPSGTNGDGENAGGSYGFEGNNPTSASPTGYEIRSRPDELTPAIENYYWRLFTPLRVGRIPVGNRGGPGTSGTDTGFQKPQPRIDEPSRTPVH